VKEVKIEVKTYSTAKKTESEKLIDCPVCGFREFKKNYIVCDKYSYIKCKKCGLVFQNPQPVQAAIIERYNGEEGAEYLKYEIANEEAFLSLSLRSIHDAGFGAFCLGGAAGGYLLDIGCATGAMLEKQRGDGWTVTGLEINASQVEYARNKRSLDVRCSTLEDAGFEENHFAAVFASHLIEHLNNHKSFVKELFRIIEPGGSAYITTPNIAGFQAKIFGKNWRSAINDHLFLFSVKTLKQLLKNEGFVIKKTVTWGGLAKGIAPAPIKKLADILAKLFGTGDVMIIRAQKT
jgi:2-polyprenyl-3-methyl-5-hydroxy-6-metoxy-1,4-benzoquinol methylase